MPDDQSIFAVLERYGPLCGPLLELISFESPLELFEVSFVSRLKIMGEESLSSEAWFNVTLYAANYSIDP